MRCAYLFKLRNFILLRYGAAIGSYWVQLAGNSASPLSDYQISRTAQRRKILLKFQVPG
jgi:hypothetical protein